MKTICISLACIAVASLTIAAVSKPSKERLTPERILELTAPTEAPAPNGYKITISGLGSCELPADQPGRQRVIEAIREFRFPTEFEPPKSAGGMAVTPTTPSSFVTVNTGWTVRVDASRHGNLVAIAGASDYVTVELLPGGYGPLAGPIYTDKGEMLSPNKVDQPKFQTTTTHFHLFAVPGESYEITLYRGDKSEKHTLTLTER